METLFLETPWYEVEQRVRRGLEKEVNVCDRNQLLDRSVDDLCEYFVNKFRVNIPTINRKEIKKDYEDTQVVVSGNPMYAADDQSGPVYTPGVRFEITVPYTGEMKAFRWQPTRSTLNPPRALVRHSKKYLLLEIIRTNLEADAVVQEINSTLDKIDDYLTYLREDADKLNSDLESFARQCIEKRRTDLQKNLKLFASLPFKLKERDDSPKTFKAPEVRRKITPKSPQRNSQPYQQEPVLDEEDYEHILKVIENMAKVMEYSPAAFSEMSEETLRWHFLVQLNGHYEGQATGETFNYGGKTDILVKVDGKNIFIAECKFWRGPQKLTETIGQLLGYSSWRDTKVAVIVFNRNKDFTRVLDSIKLTTKKHPNCKRELGQRSETSFPFIFSHRDDVNREMTLTVMAFDVPK